MKTENLSSRMKCQEYSPSIQTKVHVLAYRRDLRVKLSFFFFRCCFAETYWCNIFYNMCTRIKTTTTKYRISKGKLRQNFEVSRRPNNVESHVIAVSRFEI